ncbi:unnamed protein product [Closterium sp. Naga37s-1]|nr:unnamed protein product [Closterium sp. Naga37s-1]
MPTPIFTHSFFSRLTSHPLALLSSPHLSCLLPPRPSPRSLLSSIPPLLSCLTPRGTSSQSSTLTLLSPSCRMPCPSLLCLMLSLLSSLILRPSKLSSVLVYFSSLLSSLLLFTSLSSSLHLRSLSRHFVDSCPPASLLSLLPFSLAGLTTSSLEYPLCLPLLPPSSCSSSSFPLLPSPPLTLIPPSSSLLFLSTPRPLTVLLPPAVLLSAMPIVPTPPVPTACIGPPSPLLHLSPMLLLVAVRSPATPSLPIVHPHRFDTSPPPHHFLLMLSIQFYVSPFPLLPSLSFLHTLLVLLPLSSLLCIPLPPHTPPLLFCLSTMARSSLSLSFRIPPPLPLSLSIPPRTRTTCSSFLSSTPSLLSPCSHPSSNRPGASKGVGSESSHIHAASSTFSTLRQGARDIEEGARDRGKGGTEEEH